MTTLFQASKNVNQIFCAANITGTDKKTVFGSSIGKGLQADAELAFLTVRPIENIHQFIFNLANLNSCIDTRISHQTKAINEGFTVWGLDSYTLIDKVLCKFNYLAGGSRYQSTASKKSVYSTQLEYFFCTQNGHDSLSTLHAVQKELKEFFPVLKVACKELQTACKSASQCLTALEAKRNLFDSMARFAKLKLNQKVSSEIELAYLEREKLA